MIRFPPKTILVPFDFTQASRAAWDYARLLSARCGASVHAAYVAQWRVQPGEAPLLVELTPRQRWQLRARLSEALGPGARLHVAQGDVVAELLRLAKDLGADLIVMGTAGRRGLSRAVLGSLTEALVRVSPLPVLSLKRPAGLPSKVLAPVTLEPYSRPGLIFAREVARSLGAAVTAFNVATGPLETAPLRRLEALAEDHGARLELRAGSPVRRIVEESAGCDLVVLVAHRRGLFRGGILGTTAEQVLRRSAAPVLTVPTPAWTPPPARSAGRKTTRRRGPSARRRGGRAVMRAPRRGPERVRA